MEAGKPFEPVSLEPDCVCAPCPEVADGADTDEAVADAIEDAPVTEEDEQAEVESVGTDGDPFAAALLAQETAATPEPEVSETPTAPALPAWSPTNQGPNWGVRLVSVVPGSSPPQAVLGLSDGESKVVQAGDMLPSAGVVVIAIGRDRIQLAQVKPAGDHAIVESVQLNAMYPSAQP